MEQNLNQQVLAENSNHEIDHDKLWGIVAYFLFLIPLLVVKNRSSFLNYHINYFLSLNEINSKIRNENKYIKLNV